MAPNTALQTAHSAVVHGFDSVDAELIDLLDEARRSDVSPVLVDVAGDRAAPGPVRERALGRVVVELSRSMPQSPLPGWVTKRVRQQRRHQIHCRFRKQG